MAATGGTTFVQVSDIHIAPTDVGGNATLELDAIPESGGVIAPEYREHLLTLTPMHLRDAVTEINAIDPRPAFALMTGDQVTGGTQAEIERYLQLTESLTMPRYHNGANHDLGRSPSAFDELIGPRRQMFDHGGVRFLIMDEYQRVEPFCSPYWRCRVLDEHLSWLREACAAWAPKPVVLVMHAPMQRVDGGEWADAWRGADADRLVHTLDELGNIIAIVSGHWHVNDTWMLNSTPGTLVINTGSLAGFQCSGPDPFFLVPVRPGYRIFHWDGATLRSTWRNLHAWIDAQIVHIGDVHTYGPRPQVRPVTISGKTDLAVQAYAPGRRIDAVEWRLAKITGSRGSRAVTLAPGGWRAMTCAWSNLWSEWTAVLDPAEHAPGEYVLLSRARRETDDRWAGHDAVAVTFAPDAGAPAVRAARETYDVLPALPFQD